MSCPATANARNAPIFDGSGMASATPKQMAPTNADDAPATLALGPDVDDRRVEELNDRRESGAPCRTSRCRSTEMPALRAKNGIVVADEAAADAVGNAGDAEEPRRWDATLGCRRPSVMSSLSAGASMSKRMSGPKDPKGVSRRELLTFWRRPLETAVKTIKPPPPLEMPIARPPPLRPPGMLHELMLQQALHPLRQVRRGLPGRRHLPARRRLGRGRGHAGDRRAQAAVRARAPACSARTSVRRARCCRRSPTTTSRMGTAQLDASTCLTHHGQACTACVEHCPRPGALVLDGPHGELRVDEEQCVGCGLCEHFCPTEPQSIRVQPRA